MTRRRAYRDPYDTACPAPRWTTFRRTSASAYEFHDGYPVVLSCPVCYAPTDAVVRESMNLGIFVLLGVTGIVLAGVARFMVSVARRSRAVALDDVESMLNR